MNVVFLIIIGAAAGFLATRLMRLETDIVTTIGIGITAGASAPEVLVEEVVDAFRARYDVTIEEVETAQENVEFKVPRVLRETA